MGIACHGVYPMGHHSRPFRGYVDRVAEPEDSVPDPDSDGRPPQRRGASGMMLCFL